MAKKTFFTHVWARALSRWRSRPVHPRSPILEELYSDHTSLFRLESNAPGIVVLWRIVHAKAGNDLLFAVVNQERFLRDIRRPRKPSASPTVDAWERAFTRELQRYGETEEALSVDGTHLVLVCWISKGAVSRVTASGERLCGFSVEPVGSWACRLGSWNDVPAARIARAIACRIANLGDAKFNTWEELVRKIDWQEWLDVYAKAALGKHHVLQPPRNWEP